MSSGKRRRLDEAITAQSPASAVSAIAARRLLAANQGSPKSSVEEEALSANVNAFEALRGRAKEPAASGNIKKTASKTLRNRDSAAPSTPNSPGGKNRPTAPVSEDKKILLPRSLPYSSFALSKHNHRIKSPGIAELRLNKGERFTVLGSFGIRVLIGEITVAGATLRPSDDIQWIHAPVCHALPVLRNVEKTSIELHVDKNLQCLKRLGRLSPLFRNLWSDSFGDVSIEPTSKESTYQILPMSNDAPKKSVIQELTSPPEWNMKLAALVSAVSKSDTWKVLICGPKSAGKSTFTRLLTNRLLSDSSLRNPSRGVAVLDLDPGQPEFNPPGTLSLIHVQRPNLGVPFTHPGLDDHTRTVVKFHTLASITPASAPDLFLECVFDLFTTYTQEFPGCPLLINTAGWILGTGLDLLAEIISHINPTEVLYMSEDGPTDTVDTLQATTKLNFTELPSQQAEFTSRTAAHFRAMQVMSYFHLKADNLPNVAPPTLTWDASAISSLPPWQVRYSDPHSGISCIISYGDQAPPDLLADAINGMVLAVVEVQHLDAFRDLIPPPKQSSPSSPASKSLLLDAAISRTPEGIPYIPNPADVALDPRHSHAIGLVLIRGIDTPNQTLQIVTPMPLQRIQQVKERGGHIVLVHGNFDAPSWAYAESLYERPGQDESSGGVDGRPLEVVDEETSDDDSDAVPDEDGAGQTGDIVAVPWVEVLRSHQKRPVGSRVWRVRRDLGKGD